jgi:hypothetical protein
VGNRKALLIGIEEYGDGFAPLPAVREDLRCLGEALKNAGYEIELCPAEVLANASSLGKRIRAFCESGGEDDVRLIYFTGHGIRVDNVDWVIPARVSRTEAAEGTDQRVSTDLSKTVAKSSTGLVLFVIDACRDEADVPGTKGGAGWGDHSVARPGQERFIRFFGCSADQVCQIVAPTGNAPACSLFTRSLAECISRGDALSLEELLPRVTRRCDDLLTKNVTLRVQVPRLSYGELSGELQSVLRKAIFDTIHSPPIRPPSLSSVWPEFDPDRLHCLVVLSEREKSNSPDWGLTQLVRDAIAGATGHRIWNSFREAAGNVRLVSGQRRSPPEDFERSAVRIGAFSVLDAFASDEALDTAVRALAEADLVAFDVTGFEPGIMFLVGVRSACRRWLTVCSHGNNWREGQPLELPFNLSDLNIGSHTARESLTGPDPVVERFVCRVETGFTQAAKQPHYLDLPGYDALRRLGSHYTASSTIDPGERILVLCAYAKHFFGNWQFISSHLKQTLSLKKAAYNPEIERVIDYGTTQLTQQGIYEQIRRAAACVVDWSEFSASVFLELGTRLAVSEWGAIQIIDDRYLPGRERAPKPALEQVELMRRRLHPMPYTYRDETAGALEQVAEVLLQRNPSLDHEPDYNRIHRSLLAVVGAVQPAQPTVIEELERGADSLHHPDQGRVGAPQILFHGSRLAKLDCERAALERRIAAWLYLEHRVRRARLKEDAALLRSYRDLGRSAIDALYDLGDEASLDLASDIEDRLRQKDLPDARSS